MKRGLIWSGVAILVLAAAAWWIFKPQVVQLDRTTKLTLLGVEYGRHHKFPALKTTTRMRGGPTSFDTTNDTLVVWVLQEQKSVQRYGWQAQIYDRAETAVVTSWARNIHQIRQDADVEAIQLDAFPRRDNKFFMRFMSYDSRGEHLSKGHFVISNPVRGKFFEKWTPDPLPNTQSNGDLAVTLTEFAANAPLPYVRNGTSKNDPASKCVQLDFDIQQKRQAVTNWRPVQVEISDATGNEITEYINEYRQNGQREGYFYQWGLWPNEPAWKLRVEMSRTSGFNDDDLWTMQNIPVRAGNQQDVWNYWGNRRNADAAFAETTINGVHVKLFPAIQYTTQNYFNGRNTKVVSVIFKTNPDAESAGMRMTPLTVTDDQGRTLHNQGASWGGGDYQYEYPASGDIQSVNVTIALHKSRFVEFAVKPAQP